MNQIIVDNKVIFSNDKSYYVLWRTKAGRPIPIFGRGEKHWTPAQTKEWKKKSAEEKKEGKGSEIKSMMKTIEGKEDEYLDEYSEEVKGRFSGVSKQQFESYRDNLAEELESKMSVVTESSAKFVKDNIEKGVPSAYHVEGVKTGNYGKIASHVGVEDGNQVYGHLSHGNHAGWGDARYSYKMDSIKDRAIFHNGDTLIDSNNAKDLGKLKFFTHKTATKQLALGLMDDAAGDSIILHGMKRDIRTNGKTMFNRIRDMPTSEKLYPWEKRSPKNRHIEVLMFENNGGRIKSSRIDRIQFASKGAVKGLSKGTIALAKEKGIRLTILG